MKKIALLALSLLALAAIPSQLSAGKTDSSRKEQKQEQKDEKTVDVKGYYYDGGIMSMRLRIHDGVVIGVWHGNELRPASAVVQKSWSPATDGPEEWRGFAARRSHVAEIDNHVVYFDL